MNATVIFRVTVDGRDGARIPEAAGWYRGRREPAASVALWVFMAVAATLFSLFIAAYVMRMDGTDWSAIAMPWHLWLSTTLLVTGSVLLQRASIAGRGRHWGRAHMLLLAGGACALAFLGAQLWAWQALWASRVTPVGNPAGSFFYLLTAMHGLHVAGGLVGWGMTARSLRRHADSARVAWRITLCARYWHFLLAVWLVLFATLGWLTPEVVRFICGTR